MDKDKATIPTIAPSEYTTTSRIIFKGPCVVKCVHVAAEGANAACQVYDGLNTQGKLKARIDALSGTSEVWLPGDGTDFDQGIYIAVNAATTHVTVTFLPESRKDFI